MVRAFELNSWLDIICSFNKICWIFNWVFNTDNRSLFSLGSVHILSYEVCLLLLFVGGRLGMASGSATRDVHLFNSIIGVYQLSYRRVHCMGGGKSRAGVCTCIEWARLCQSLPWAPALSGVSGGTRRSPPLASADISIHGGLFMPVGLLLYVQVVTQVCFPCEYVYCYQYFMVVLSSLCADMDWYETMSACMQTCTSPHATLHHWCFASF